MPADPQRTYEIYIDDDRYGVPTLHLVMAEDDEEAREIMERLLDENRHHIGGEIFLAGRVLFRAGSFALKRRPSQAAEGDERLSG